MELAIFDFDGTITDRDSFEDFLLMTHGGAAFWGGILLLSPMLFLFLLRIISNSKAKETVFSHFFKGWEEGRFDQACLRYSREQMPRIIRPSAFARLRWHKEKGHRVVIVSASFENYLKPWCESHGFDLLATQVAKEDGHLTGRFSSQNCFGEEKIRRLKTVYRLEDFSHIYAYGDSRGDLCLTQLTKEFYYKPFGKNFSYQIYKG